jgi:hypothetical protein
MWLFVDLLTFAPLPLLHELETCAVPVFIVFQ